MANIFEKLRLVERKSEDILGYEIQEIVADEETEVVNVNLSGIDVQMLIETIYTENNLADKTRSIFKVRELIHTLPKEMSNATKKTTVLGILAVSGLTVEEVREDGVNRINHLHAVHNKIVDDCEAKVALANSEIEEMKAKIEKLQKMVALTETEKETSMKLITDEVDNIVDLCKFIEEGEIK